MALGRKTWRERAAQEPEFSFLSAAFDVPSPREMLRREEHRLPQYGGQRGRRDPARSSPAVANPHIVPTTQPARTSHSRRGQTSTRSGCNQEGGAKRAVVSSASRADQRTTGVEEETDDSGAETDNSHGEKIESIPIPDSVQPRVGDSAPRSVEKNAPSAHVSRKKRPHRQRPKSSTAVQSDSAGDNEASALHAPSAAVVQPFPPVHTAPQYIYPVAEATGHLATVMPRPGPPHVAQPVPARVVQGHTDPATALPQQTSASQVSPGNFILELQRIQLSLDQALDKLARSPNDTAAREHVKALQDQLNVTLNHATSRGSRGPPRVVPPLSSEMHEEKQQTLQTGDRVENQEAVNNLRWHGSAHVPEESPHRVIHHHLCSGCGDIRSRMFHKKQPIIQGMKPIINYCGSCRESKIGVGLMVHRHHFCFGCGIVRSRAFQRRNPTALNEPMLPNYCAKCRVEALNTDFMMEVSVLALVSPSRS